MTTCDGDRLQKASLLFRAAFSFKGKNFRYNILCDFVLRRVANNQTLTDDDFSTGKICPKSLIAATIIS
jgi:hypothetical protein